MLSVIAFGRISGAARFQYGPTTFSKDWGGLFTALEIMDLLEKISIPSSNAHENVVEIAANFISEPPSGDVSQLVQHVKAQQLLTALELLAQDIEHIQVTSEIKGRFSRNSVDARFIRFESTQGKRPAQLIAEGLLDMDLNGWGYMSQIVTALNRFTSRSRDRDAGHRCMSVFFTAQPAAMFICRMSARFFVPKKSCFGIPAASLDAGSYLEEGYAICKSQLRPLGMVQSFERLPQIRRSSRSVPACANSARRWLG